MDAEQRAALDRAARQPGTRAVDLYADGAEVVGGPDDLDESAGFVTGQFTPEQVAEVTGLPVSDLRQEA